MLPLIEESWTWYGVAVLIILLRYYSRWLQLGSLKAFLPEDYVMLVVLGFYTSLVANMNTVSHLDTNLMLPSDIPTLTPESIQSRMRGSKLVLVVEQSMIMTQWGCKICLLLLYNKLTFGLTQQWAVKCVAVYVVVGWAIMEILYFGVWCRPFHNYWAVPTPNDQCSAAIHHLITNTVFNISSDVMMLCIPLPLLLKTRLRLHNKIILCVLFSLGTFVILCAVLNKYYSFAHPFSPMWMYWYIREASTAIFVANMPMCWSLVRRVFRLKAFGGQSTTGVIGGLGSMSNVLDASVTKKRIPSDAEGSGSGSKNHDRSWWDREPGFEDWKASDSEEYVNRIPPGSSSGKERKAIPLEIWESRAVDVDIDRPGRSLDRSDTGLRRRSEEMDRVLGPRTEMGMFDGRGVDYETRTTVTSPTPSSLGRVGRLQRSLSRKSNQRDRSGTPGSGRAIPR